MHVIPLTKAVLPPPFRAPPFLSLCSCVRAGERVGARLYLAVTVFGISAKLRKISIYFCLDTYTRTLTHKHTHILLQYAQQRDIVGSRRALITATCLDYVRLIHIFSNFRRSFISHAHTLEREREREREREQSVCVCVCVCVCRCVTGTSAAWIVWSRVLVNSIILFLEYMPQNVCMIACI